MNLNFCQNVNSQTPIRWSRKLVTVDELIRFYGLTMLVENTYANNTHNMRKHFKSIKQQYGRVKGLGMDRFEQLTHAFNPSIQQIKEITDILHNQFTM